MKNYYTLLMCIASFGLILNIYALPVSDEDYHKVFHRRTKIAASGCSRLEYDGSCPASGDKMPWINIATSNFNIALLVSFPFSFEYFRDGADGSINLSYLVALCEKEGPRASCLKDLSVERNCGGGKNAPYGYVEQLCSAEGLLLASAAMTSPCLQKPWIVQPHACKEIGGVDDFTRSCSIREQYSQCVTEAVRGQCGAAFTELIRLLIDGYLQSHNYHRSPHRVQC